MLAVIGRGLSDVAFTSGKLSFSSSQIEVLSAHIAFQLLIYWHFSIEAVTRFTEYLTHCPGKIRGQMERMLVAAATPVLTNIGLAKLPDGCEVFSFSHIYSNFRLP